MKRRVAYIMMLGALLLSALPALAEERDGESAQREKEQVILLHGYGRSARAMRAMEQRFVERGYDVHIIEYSSIMRSMDEIQREVTREIDEVIREHPQRTHFVGHSLGGLLARAYLKDKKLDRLGRVVTLGSPNRGTPAVNQLSRKWWFWMVGSAARSLSSSGSDFLSKLPEPHYPLGVIAGRARHPFVRGTSFSGAHDGLVSIESTKVEGMKDFCVIPVNHTALRYKQSVFMQALHFLKRGHFDCPSEYND